MSRTAGACNKRGRADAYPEGMTFRDTGCEVSPTCLGCPLARCRYDVLGGERVELARERRARVRELMDAGVEADAVAVELGVSLRTVFRMRREAIVR